eukprot:4030197-Lingulodinium_polyedra.AAC.1
MSAVIATLMDIHWKPAAPDIWYEPDGIDRWEIQQSGSLHDFAERLVETAMVPLWQHASKHWAGAGLEQ